MQDDGRLIFTASIHSNHKYETFIANLRYKYRGRLQQKPDNQIKIFVLNGINPNHSLKCCIVNNKKFIIISKFKELMTYQSNNVSRKFANYMMLRRGIVDTNTYNEWRYGFDKIEFTVSSEYDDTRTVKIFYRNLLEHKISAGIIIGLLNA